MFTLGLSLQLLVYINFTSLTLRRTAIPSTWLPTKLMGLLLCYNSKTLGISDFWKGRSSYSNQVNIDNAISKTSSTSVLPVFSTHSAVKLVSLHEHGLEEKYPVHFHCKTEEGQTWCCLVNVDLISVPMKRQQH